MGIRGMQARVSECRRTGLLSAEEIADDEPRPIVARCSGMRERIEDRESCRVLYRLVMPALRRVGSDRSS